jgi:hypothetical protein
MASRSAYAGRRRVQAELFPFLSVLACMIGCLVLLIIILSSSVLGSTRSITLVARDAAGNNLDLTPEILEVTAKGVLIHSTGEFVPSGSIARANTPLRRLLVRVAANRKAEYIIVAVRPDGYALFDRVRRQVEGRGIEIGYEPIDEEWRVRIRK